MTPERLLTILLTPAISTFGFAVMFRVRMRHLPASTVGGILAYLFYLGAADLIPGEFFANFVAAFLAAIYCEICARVLRAPVQIYLIPVLVPLFPGGMLYYAMYYLVAQNYTLFTENLILTLEAAFGIAGGMIVGLAVTAAVLSLIRRIRKPKQTKNMSDLKKEDSNAD
jgi:uncharacterized membrane protein YjjB (DUF3815 family)